MTSNVETDTCELKKSETLEIEETDISKKDIRKNILQIAWPSIIELVLVHLCQMADTIMVGGLGPEAIAAVGLTSQPRFVMLATFIALNVGTTAVVARVKGEGNRKLANVVLRQSLILCLFISIIVSVLGVVFSKKLIVLMGGEPETVILGTEYFSILMYGFSFTTVALTVSAALKGAGNTKAVMQFNMAANIVNVIFNYLLIGGKFGFPALGVRGAAIATVIGYFVSFVMALVTLFKGNNYIKLTLHDSFKPDFTIIKRIIKIGLPSACEQFFLRLGLLIYTRTVSSLGTISFAAHQIALSIHTFSFVNGQGIGVAATSLVGQSLGKKRPDLAKKYISESRLMGLAMSSLLALCLIFLRTQLVSLYTDSAQVIEITSKILFVVAFLQPFQCAYHIQVGSLRGAGDIKWTAFTIFVGIILIRPLLSLLFVFIFKWGLIGAWIAFSVDQLWRSLITYYRIKSGKWTKIKV